LFADISGFTAWASIHTPAEVFKLLETLYAAFDKIARKRRVFKVETIGDCYVAVTGLPNPQDSHAVIMTRFASECLLAVHPVLHSLVDKLGVETLNLGMRVGINSGPVTAGILRAEKARFQLFGDTVNTAARMESCGQMGRVHVSESTAALLQSAGKGGWVTRREDVVEAKGKGSLQTYWIAPEVDFSATVKDTQSDTLSLSRGGSNHGKSRGRSSSLHSSTENRSEDEVLMQRAVGRLVKQSSARFTVPMQSDDGMMTEKGHLPSPSVLCVSFIFQTKGGSSYY
jgi:class 3 adenylate cyclase